MRQGDHNRRVIEGDDLVLWMHRGYKREIEDGRLCVVVMVVMVVITNSSCLRLEIEEQWIIKRTILDFRRKK